MLINALPFLTLPFLPLPFLPLPFLPLPFLTLFPARASEELSPLPR
jgi:hypothetical protein